MTQALSASALSALALGLVPFSSNDVEDDTARPRRLALFGVARVVGGYAARSMGDAVPVLVDEAACAARRWLDRPFFFSGAGSRDATSEGLGPADADVSVTWSSSSSSRGTPREDGLRGQKPQQKNPETSTTNKGGRASSAQTTQLSPTPPSAGAGADPSSRGQLSSLFAAETLAARGAPWLGGAFGFLVAFCLALPVAARAGPPPGEATIISSDHALHDSDSGDFIPQRLAKFFAWYAAFRRSTGKVFFSGKRFRPATCAERALAARDAWRATLCLVSCLTLAARFAMGRWGSSYSRYVFHTAAQPVRATALSMDGSLPGQRQSDNNSSPRASASTTSTTTKNKTNKASGKQASSSSKRVTTKRKSSEESHPLLRREAHEEEEDVDDDDDDDDEAHLLSDQRTQMTPQMPSPSSSSSSSTRFLPAPAPRRLPDALPTQTSRQQQQQRTPRASELVVPSSERLVPAGGPVSSSKTSSSSSQGGGGHAATVVPGFVQQQQPHGARQHHNQKTLAIQHRKKQICVSAAALSADAALALVHFLGGVTLQVALSLPAREAAVCCLFGYAAALPCGAALGAVALKVAFVVSKWLTSSKTRAKQQAHQQPQPPRVVPDRFDQNTHRSSSHHHHLSHAPQNTTTHGHRGALRSLPAHNPSLSLLNSRPPSLRSVVAHDLLPLDGAVSSHALLLPPKATTLSSGSLVAGPAHAASSSNASKKSRRVLFAPDAAATSFSSDHYHHRRGPGSSSLKSPTSASETAAASKRKRDDHLVASRPSVDDYHHHHGRGAWSWSSASAGMATHSRPGHHQGGQAPKVVQVQATGEALRAYWRRRATCLVALLFSLAAASLASAAVSSNSLDPSRVARLSLASITAQCATLPSLAVLDALDQKKNGDSLLASPTAALSRAAPFAVAAAFASRDAVLHSTTTHGEHVVVVGAAPQVEEEDNDATSLEEEVSEERDEGSSSSTGRPPKQTTLVAATTAADGKNGNATTHDAASASEEPAEADRERRSFAGCREYAAPADFRSAARAVVKIGYLSLAALVPACLLFALCLLQPPDVVSLRLAALRSRAGGTSSSSSARDPNTTTTTGFASSSSYGDHNSLENASSSVGGYYYGASGSSSSSHVLYHHHHHHSASSLTARPSFDQDPHATATLGRPSGGLGGRRDMNASLLPGVGHRRSGSGARRLTPPRRRLHDAARAAGHAGATISGRASRLTGGLGSLGSLPSAAPPGASGYHHHHHHSSGSLRSTPASSFGTTRPSDVSTRGSGSSSYSYSYSYGGLPPGSHYESFPVIDQP